MTAVGAVPDWVLERATRRLTAHHQLRYCVTPGCDQPATHSPCTGHDSCETHRIVTPNPTPDPTRTEPYLRANHGVPGTPNRTNFDNTVEAKGQRISAARRAELRGPNKPEET